MRQIKILGIYLIIITYLHNKATLVSHLKTRDFI